MWRNVPRPLCYLVIIGIILVNFIAFSCASLIFWYMYDWYSQMLPLEVDGQGLLLIPYGVVLIFIIFVCGALFASPFAVLQFSCGLVGEIIRDCRAREDKQAKERS